MAIRADYRIYTYCFKFQVLSLFQFKTVCQTLAHTATRSVLVMSLAINALDLNLRARCNIMHLFDLALTKSIMDQAIGRLRRYGQQMVVVAIRLFSECWLDHITASKACDDFLGLNLHPRCNIMNFFDVPPNIFIVPQSYQ